MRESRESSTGLDSEAAAVRVRRRARGSHNSNGGANSILCRRIPSGATGTHRADLRSHHNPALSFPRTSRVAAQMLIPACAVRAAPSFTSSIRIIAYFYVIFCRIFCPFSINILRAGGQGHSNIKSLSLEMHLLKI